MFSLHVVAIVSAVYIFVQRFKRSRSRKEKSPQLNEKSYEHIPMTTKDSGGWKYKRLEDQEDEDSSDSKVTDEHKKMLS